MSGNPQQTRPPRRAAPKIGRAGARIFASLAKKTRYAEPALVDHWPDIVGAEIANLCRPGRLAGRPPGSTLELYVASGAAAAQIQLQLEKLKTDLNRYLGPGSVSRITLVHKSAIVLPTRLRKDAKNELGSALSTFRNAIKSRNNDK